MLDQLQDIIRNVGQQTVVENPDVPNEQNEAVMQEAATSTYSGLQEIVQQHGVGGLTQLFQGVQGGNAQSNPAVQQLSNGVAGNIMSKLGLGSGTAQKIAMSMIPMVIGQLFNRTKDPNHKGLDIGGLLSSLGVGGAGAVPGTTTGTPSSGGIGGMISSIGGKMGLDKDGDGDTDLNDLMKMFR